MPSDTETDPRRADHARQRELVIASLIRRPAGERPQGKGHEQRPVQRGPS